MQSLDLKKDLNFKRIIERIPKQSFIHSQPEDLQKEIIRDMFSEMKPMVQVKKLAELGCHIQTNHLARIKRALGPIWLHLNSSNTFFSDFETNILPKLKRLETLINRHYENILEYFETENEEKNVLELKGSLLNVGITAEQYKELLGAYYEDTISEENRAFLLSFSSKRKPSSTMEVKLKSFFAIVEDYVKLKAVLKKSQDEVEDDAFRTGMDNMPSFLSEAKKKKLKTKEEPEISDLDIDAMKELLRSDRDAEQPEEDSE